MGKNLNGPKVRLVRTYQASSLQSRCRNSVSCRLVDINLPVIRRFISETMGVPIRIMGQYMLVENDIYNMISTLIAPNSTQFGSNNTAQAMEYCQAVQT